MERTKTAMESLAESMREQPAMPRFEDGSVNLRELMRRIAEDVVNAIMDAERKSNAQIEREALEGFVAERFDLHKGRYGYRRINRELRRDGIVATGQEAPSP